MSPEDKIRSGQPSATRLRFSELKLDRYRIDGVLGAGGMGEVFSGVHSVTQRRCALKLLPEQLCRQSDFVTRFHTEAKTVARLNHPHIVQIYTGGESGGRFFLEMEYIDGGDLQRRVLEYHQVTGSGLPEAEIRRVTDAILSALIYAHEQGVIHRDLKPANVLLSKAGAVKVSDFGLAAVVGEDMHRTLIQESISLANVGSLDTTTRASAASSSGFAGTILYMSPQALRCEPPDARDDLFSLGVLVYFMFAGKTPTVNYTPISRIRPEIGRKWDKFIATCLEDERKNRFASAAAARQAIPAPAGKRGARVLSLGLAAAVVVLGAFLWFNPEKLNRLRSNAAPQSINFAPIADRVISSTGFAPAATASSGLQVSYAIVSGPAQIVDGTVVATGVGTVVIRASQPGNSGFAAAKPVEQTFRVIGPATGTASRKQSIRFPAITDSRVGATPVELTATATSGLPVVFKVVKGPATVSGNRLTFLGAGTVTVRGEQAGDASYLPAVVEQSFEVVEPIPENLKVALPGGIEVKFVRVPGGTAVLGSPESEPGRHAAYEALREFSSAEGFLLGATEVTQAEYQALTRSTPSYHRDKPKHPVEQVPFKAAESYLAEFNKRLRELGLHQWIATLPSDDEWEYACRAGTKTPFYNQATLTGSGGANISRIAVLGSETKSVGSLEPNAHGLFDLHGNVAEWTRAGTLRGGSFMDAVTECRAAFRLRGQEGMVDRRFGFRIMLQRAKPTPP